MLRVDKESFIRNVLSKNCFDMNFDVIVDDLYKRVGLPVKVLRQPGFNESINCIVFFFHGAVNRKARKLPVFEGNFLSRENLPGCLLVSIGDPGLRVSREISATWYAGTSKIDLPNLINIFIAYLLEKLSPHRVVFTGGSIGGYPALSHGARVKDSIVILMNPILNINLYYYKHRKAYSESGWGVAPEKLGDCVELDSFEYYARGKEINLIYVQGATDHHFWKQSVHFLSRANALNSGFKDNFLFMSSHFNGYNGHKFPPKQWAKWVRSACLAKTSNVVDVAEHFNSLNDSDYLQKSLEKRIDKKYFIDDCAIQDKIATFSI